MVTRILIAEDHADSLELMSYLLRAHGYEVIAATDGETALERARIEHPDLIICDLQMPKANGYEVARQLRGDVCLCAIPLIAVTAFSMIGDREKVLTAGFDGYFSKPIQVDRFVSDLQRYLPQALRSDQRVSGAKRDGA